MTECTPNQHAERLSEALQGKPIRGGWRAHCPAHDDHEPSLDISVKGGRVLWICRAGCDQARVLEALRDRELWPREGERNRPVQPARGEPSARYRYVDASGQALTLLRYDEMKRGERRKRFTWIGPNGQTGLQGAKPLIYRAERLRGLPADTAIVWCEGPKCVELFESLGLVATCGYSGTTVTIDESDVALLIGHEVWIVPDNDEPGRKHGQEVMATLKAAGVETVWVELPGLPKKGDVEQWISAGGTREAFLELVERAKASGADGKPRLVTLPSMLDVVEEEIDWLWPPYIPRGKLTLVEGDPGSGKSWLMLAVATALSLGAPLPGLPERREPQRVLMMMAEDGLADTVKPRLRMLGAIQSRIRPVIGLMTEGEEQMMMLSHEGVIALEYELAHFRPALVIVDPLVAYLGGSVDMNKSNEVRAILRPVGDMAQRYGVAIVGVRHLTKAIHGIALYRGQGSIDFTAISRSVLLVGKDPDDPQRRIMVPSKASLAEEGEGQAFRITRGATGVDFLWDGGADMTTTRLLTGLDDGEEAGALGDAMEFLRDALHEGPKPGKDIQREAREAGVSERTLWRAKSRIRVKARKQTGTGIWTWELPLLADMADMADMPESQNRRGINDLNNSANSANSAKEERKRLPYRDSDDDEEIV